jgi:hypothetical protein
MKSIIGLLIVVMAIIFSYWLFFGNKIESNTIHNQTGLTEMQIVNETKDSALVYITLGGGFDSTFIQNINGIFGCTQTGLVGSFWLHSKDTLSYTPTLSFSGNISFGSRPLNCPTNTWETGVNIFEFNLNEPQESIDISCVAGVNCILRCELIGGANWVADTCANPRVLQNDDMYKNSRSVGVYPYGCTDCIDTLGRQDCQQPTEIPNKYKICNPTRAKGEKGGVVRVVFKGYTEISNAND